MFGVQSLAENSLSTQGIVLLGSESLDANFTQSTDLSAILNGSMDVIGAFSKISAASGLLTADVEITSDFTQTAQGLRFATGIAELDANFTQTGIPNITASGVSEQSANFGQTSTQTLIAGGTADVSANFTQTAAAVRILYGLQEAEANFDVNNALGGMLFSATFDATSEFLITETLAGLIRFGSTSVNSLFIKSVQGELLWEPVDSSTTVEIWVPITHSGDTWTQINAGGTIEQWNQKVV